VTPRRRNRRLTNRSTGVTGYIAGDALYALNEKHPDYEYSALVRTQEKADIVKKAYPNIRIVLGGNDDSDLIKEEAAKADVVLRKLIATVLDKLQQRLTCKKTPPTLLTTRVPPKPSPRAFAPATPRRSPATGCTPEVPVS
jgi:hypothetical protein